MEIDLSTHDLSSDDLDSLERQVRFERLKRRVHANSNAADEERYLERREIIDESLLPSYLQCLTAQALAGSEEEAQPWRRYVLGQFLKDLRDWRWTTNSTSMLYSRLWPVASRAKLRTQVRRRARPRGRWNDPYGTPIAGAHQDS